MARALVIAAVLAMSMAVAMAQTTSVETVVVPEKWASYKAKNPLCSGKLRSASATYQCYYKTIKELMDLAAKVDPRRPELAVLTMAPYLDPRIEGRTSAGEFTGIALSAEYFASAIPSFFATGWSAKRVVLSGFSAGVGPVAGFSVDFELESAVVTGLKINWSLIGFWRFDARSNRVSNYDLDFRRFSEFIGALDLFTKSAFAAQVQTATVGFICQSQAAICTGANQQWASVEACVAELTPKPFMRADSRTQSDNLVCRQIHSVLLRYDPDTHCPHVGPKGGGICTDTPTWYQGYSAYYGLFPQPTYLQRI